MNFLSVACFLLLHYTIFDYCYLEPKYTMIAGRNCDLTLKENSINDIDLSTHEVNRYICSRAAFLLVVCQHYTK